MKMAIEILKIDASWAEEFTKTSEQILMTPSVHVSTYLVPLVSSEVVTECSVVVGWAMLGWRGQ